MTAPDPFALARYSDDDYSAEGAAAVEFEPTDTAAFVAYLTEPKWSQSTLWLGVYLRVATVLAEKTKAEVVQVVRDMVDGEGGEDLLFETLDQLDIAQKKLAALSALATAAMVRFSHRSVGGGD